jgi:hypothetical protein
VQWGGGGGGEADAEAEEADRGEDDADRAGGEEEAAVATGDEALPSGDAVVFAFAFMPALFVWLLLLLVCAGVGARTSGAAVRRPHAHTKCLLDSLTLIHAEDAERRTPQRGVPGVRAIAAFSVPCKRVAVVVVASEDGTRVWAPAEGTSGHSGPSPSPLLPRAAVVVSVTACGRSVRVNEDAIC